VKKTVMGEGKILTIKVQLIASVFYIGRTYHVARANKKPNNNQNSKKNKK